MISHQNRLFKIILKVNRMLYVVSLCKLRVTQVIGEQLANWLRLTKDSF